MVSGQISASTTMPLTAALYPAGKMVFGIAFNACKFEAYNEPLDIVNNLLKSMQGLGLNPLYKYLPFLEVPVLLTYVCRMFALRSFADLADACTN